MEQSAPIKGENKTGLIFFPAFDWEISPAHPERKERLLYTRDQIFEEGLLDIENIVEYNPELADKKEVQRVHIGVPSLEEVTTESHMISAGGAVKAAKLVLEEKVEKAFAIIRPPGHHAFRVVHGARGFCNINNEAVMVEYIKNKYPDEKIAFVDTDAHHADGTQEIFYHDPQVLHISLHQDGRTLFPGSGFLQELGGPGAYAKTINIPLPPGTTDQGLLYVIKELVLPVLSDFNPDLVINSAGQDNHYSDPLTNMKISAQGYAEMNYLLDPDLAVLQGGYSIESALPYINVGLILAMVGLDYSYIQEPDYDPQKLKQSEKITSQIKKTVEKLQEIWYKKDKVDLEEIYGNLDQFYTRNKDIYYDTSGIKEKQQEKVRICPDCPGYLMIDSTASSLGKTRIKAVSIPRQACKKCQEEALNKFEIIKEKARDKYDFIYLQDVKREKYISI